MLSTTQSTGVFETFRGDMLSPSIHSRLYLASNLDMIGFHMGSKGLSESLLPFISSSLSTVWKEDDEMQLSIAQNIPKLYPFLSDQGTEDIKSVVTIIEWLAAQDETAIRESAVTSLRILCEFTKGSIGESLLAPLVTRLFACEGFAPRVSAVSALTFVYPLADEEKKKELRKFAFGLATEDMPMLKRALSCHLPKYVQAISDVEILRTEVLPVFFGLAGDETQDLVRVACVAVLGELLKRLPPSELSDNAQFRSVTGSLLQDNSWRVRVAACKSAGQMVGSQIAHEGNVEYLLGLLAKLLKDPEQEVRMAALAAARSVFEVVPVDGAGQVLFSAVRAVSTDPSPQVRERLADTVNRMCKWGDLDSVVGPFIVPLLLSLSRDENAAVRAASMHGHGTVLARVSSRNSGRDKSGSVMAGGSMSESVIGGDESPPSPSSSNVIFGKFAGTVQAVLQAASNSAVSVKAILKSNGSEAGSRESGAESEGSNNRDSVSANEPEGPPVTAAPSLSNSSVPGHQQSVLSNGSVNGSINNGSSPGNSSGQQFPDSDINSWRIRSIAVSQLWPLFTRDKSGMVEVLASQEKVKEILLSPNSRPINVEEKTPEKADPNSSRASHIGGNSVVSPTPPVTIASDADLRGFLLKTVVSSVSDPVYSVRDAACALFVRMCHASQGSFTDSYARRTSSAIVHSSMMEIERTNKERDAEKRASQGSSEAGNQDMPSFSGAKASFLSPISRPSFAWELADDCDIGEVAASSCFGSSCDLGVGSDSSPSSGSGPGQGGSGLGLGLGQSGIDSPLDIEAVGLSFTLFERVLCSVWTHDSGSLGTSSQIAASSSANTSSVDSSGVSPGPSGSSCKHFAKSCLLRICLKLLDTIRPYVLLSGTTGLVPHVGSSKLVAVKSAALSAVKALVDRAVGDPVNSVALIGSSVKSHESYLGLQRM